MQSYHFANKGPYSQSSGFSSSHVQMWELDHKESWAPKDWWLLDCGVGGLLRVLWTARRSNQSLLKEISPKYSLEGLMVKLLYFGHLMWRADSLEKTLMLGKFEGRWRSCRQRVRWLNGTIDSMDMSLSKLQEIAKDREAWCAAVHGVTKDQTQLSDWTIATKIPVVPSQSEHSEVLRLQGNGWSTHGLCIMCPSSIFPIQSASIIIFSPADQPFQAASQHLTD